MNLSLDGKTVLITGASRGIGRECAVRMANAGARVAVNYNRSETEANDVVALVGGEAPFAVRANIGDANDVKSMIDAVVAQWGRLDVLVNNAAIFDLNRFEDEDYEAWQRGWQQTFDVNVFGAANAAFLAMHVMRKHGGGKIINV